MPRIFLEADPTKQPHAVTKPVPRRYPERNSGVKYRAMRHAEKQAFDPYRELGASDESDKAPGFAPLMENSRVRRRLRRMRPVYRSSRLT
jgi:hypothetical protein